MNSYGMDERWGNTCRKCCTDPCQCVKDRDCEICGFTAHLGYKEWNEHNCLTVLRLRVSELQTENTRMRGVEAALKSVAQVLHPHKPKDGGWTYVPAQLPELIERLRSERDQARAERDAAQKAAIDGNYIHEYSKRK